MNGDFASSCVELRPLITQDSQDLFRLVEDNRPYLSRWLPWVDKNRTLEDTLAFIMNAQKQHNSGLGYQVGIRWKDELVGVAGFQSWEPRHKCAALGYWLAENAQGRGIMTEVVSKLIDDAFLYLGLHRLEIRVTVDNVRSRAIAKRLGFTQEAILKEAEWLHGQPLDIILFRLLAHEWRSV